MSAITSSQILTATDQRIIELGSNCAQRLVGGKSSDKATSIGKRLLTLKEAYNNSELNSKEKESILFCLLKVSGKFDVAAITGSGGLGLTVAPEEEDMFLVGTADDISDYWGTGGDISGYI